MTRRSLILAAVLFAYVGMMAGPAHAGTFGNANAGDFLANLEVGSSKARQVDYRFRAEASGTVASASVFFICPGVPSGYCNGNGGDISVRLEGNNASNQPNGTVLGSGLVTDPLTGSGERTVAISGSVGLVAGQLYHLHFVNTDAAPATNWVSMDDMAIGTPVGQRQPARDDLGLSSLYRDNGGAWQNPTPRSPIFALTYADGSHHGPGVPYDNARHDSLPKNVGASNKIAEDFTPTSSVTITGANVRVQKNAGGTAGVKMFVRVAPNGTVVTSQTTAAIPTSSTPQWVHVNFSSSVVLATGTTYRFVADSTGSTSTGYTTWPLTEISWASPWKFTQGFARWSSDGGVTYGSSAADDWQFYLNTP